jgi:hypothetical protein
MAEILQWFTTYDPTPLEMFALGAVAVVLAFIIASIPQRTKGLSDGELAALDADRYVDPAWPMPHRSDVTSVVARAARRRDERESLRGRDLEGRVPEAARIEAARAEAPTACMRVIR